MENFEVFLYLIVIGVSILTIILFFKVWRMTNEVHKQFERSDFDLWQIVYSQSPDKPERLFQAMLYEYSKNPITEEKKAGWKEIYKIAKVPFPEIMEKVNSEADFRKMTRMEL